MLLWPPKIFASAWNYLKSPKRCSLQPDEVEALTWLMQRNHALAAGTAVSATNAGASPWTKPPQEPQRLQNHSLTFPLTAPTLGLGTLNLENLPSESDESTESPSDCLSNMDGGTEFGDLDNALDVCLP